MTSIPAASRLSALVPGHAFAGLRRGHHVWLVGLLAAGLVVSIGTAVDLSRRAALPKPPTVMIAPAGVGLVTGKVRTAGTITAAGERVLSQPVAARIVRLTAAPGDHVTKGQVLARIDLLSMKAELARALSELAAAEAAALEASISLERAQRRRMFPPLDGADSGGEAIQDVAMGRAMAAAAKVASREAAYLVARQRVAGGVVRAPEDGVILAREVDEGQTVPAGAALFRLAPDAQSLHLTVSVPESDLARLSVGQVARFAVPAYPGRVFTGKVVRLLPLAGPETARRLPVVIAVEHDAADLRAGMTASATIDTPTSGPVLRVPTAALLFAPRGMSASLDDPAVWISDPAGARLVRTPVEVGAVDGTFAEVRGQGLAEGTGVAVGHALTSRPEAAP